MFGRKMSDGIRIGGTNRIQRCIVQIRSGVADLQIRWQGRKERDHHGKFVTDSIEFIAVGKFGDKCGERAGEAKSDNRQYGKLNVDEHNGFEHHHS